MMNSETNEWHALDPDTVFQKVRSSPNGLDFNEAKKRLKEYGFNVLQIKNSETIPRILLRQLRNPLVYVLILSALFAFALRKFIDGGVILCVVILNTIIGFIQEYRANRIISALAAMVPHRTIVIRNGAQQDILASHVVPGDVVLLQPGDRVPVDMRLFFVKNLRCDESALTGESMPVSKRTEVVFSEASIAERKCMAFSGTYVTSGTGLGVVVATGLKTEFGKISELIENITPLETPLSLTLKKIARWITAGVCVLSAILFVVGFLRGNAFFDSVLAAVALAVAAIPEGLPAVITIASAIGVQRMAQRKAIIRQLPAVEVLGSTTVICTDKTGTLTHNEMTVQRILTPSGSSFVTGSGFSLEGQIIFSDEERKKDRIQEEVIRLLRAVILCSDATLEQTPNGCALVGDPTEIALIVAGKKLHLDEDQLRSEWPRNDVLPFEPELRMMATLNTSPSEKQYIFIKGAPEKILSACSLDESTKNAWLAKIDEMAKEGMRVLCAAEKELQDPSKTLDDKEIGDGFAILGFIGMVDPPRKEVYKAIHACHEAGITVKMVTGDHPVTAKTIGQDLGLLRDEQEVIISSELNQCTADEWRMIAAKYHVFARVSPEHKLKLVNALQESDQVVAMTGDGVNDAPALKRANIGVAMGIKGTAVAKEASDIILSDDNFASIEAAVEEGRRVYDNLLKSLSFILPTSLGQALVILIGVLFFPIRDGILLHPMLPVQILWVNLVVAVALALPLAFEIQEPDIMRRPPRKKNAPIFSGVMLIRTLLVSLLMALGVIGLFFWVYRHGISKGIDEKLVISQAQTMAVTAMMLFQIFYLFHCRRFKQSIFGINFFSNPYILIGVGIVLLAQIAFIYLPFMNHLFYSSSLNINAWLISIGVAAILFVIIAFEKTLSTMMIKDSRNH